MSVTAADGLLPSNPLSIGLTLGSTPGGIPLPGAWSILDSTHVRVEDTTSGSDMSSGLGVRMENGRVDIVNGSEIDADNVGVLMYGSIHTPDTLRLGIDGSTIRSGRGAAIRVGADEAVAPDSHAGHDHGAGADCCVGLQCGALDAGL